MLEVSRVGVAESDEEIELSLELSIGGSYGKCDKEKKMVDSSSSCKEDERVVENNNNVVIPRSGFSFSEAESGGSGPEEPAAAVADPNMKREIQALRRKEARRKREEKLRKSVVNFKGINGKVFLEAQEQQLQARAKDREMRENETLQDFPSGRKNDKIVVTNEAVKGPNFEAENVNQNVKMTQMRGLYPQQEECMGLKNSSLYPYGAPCFLGPGIVGKEENGLKEKTMFQSCGSFRPYLNGNGDMNMRNNSGTGFVDSGQNNGMSRIVSQKALSNGSMERSSSAISDYRSTSGKGGSISDTGSHSSFLQGNDRQLSVSARNHDLKQPESDSSLDKRETGKESVRAENSPKKMSLSKEAHHSKADAARTTQPDTKSNAVTSKLKVTAADPLKQSSELTENPSKIQPRNPSIPCLPQMPRVSTTGNGPNGKTVTGFLYRYTQTEVNIVCVCHGSSFSPAEFVEHAGGIDITHPLRHITMIPSFFG